ncbi:MAG: hypothetical protein V1851_02175 [Patescibacteria group bacterium]
MSRKKKFFKKEDLSKFFLVSASFLVLASVFSFSFRENDKFVPQVEAGASHNISGYAWSDNIGWISFNCLDEDTCSGIDYGVAKAEDGTLSGYAWSDNIGWVTFNQSELMNCPVDVCKAWVEGTSVKGWARALTNGDGWDGWISLGKKSTDTTNYGVSLVDKVFSGYAWGDNVVGWVSFNCSNDGSCGVGNYSVLLDSFVQPNIITFNIPSVANGVSPNISWTTENAERCTGSWVGGADICSSYEECEDGSSSAAVPVTEETTYSMTCYRGSLTDTESYTAEAFYNLGFVEGYSNTIQVSFTVTGATTTATQIKVLPFNGFQDSVTLSTGAATPQPLPSGSNYIYSNQTLSSSEYANGSSFKIYIASPINESYTIPVSGNGDILAGVNVIINAGGKTPIFEEI